MKWSDEKKIKKGRKPGDVCPFCSGRGWTDAGKCDLCRGSGRVPNK